MEQVAGEVGLFAALALMHALQSWRSRRLINRNTDKIHTEVVKVSNGWRTATDELNQAQTARILALEQQILGLDREILSLGKLLHDRLKP